MKYFSCRWPNVSYEDIVKHYGAEPIAVPRTMPSNDLQEAIYEWLREQNMFGTIVGSFPGKQCWHIQGESNRLMFQLRWA